MILYTGNLPWPAVWSSLSPETLGPEPRGLLGPLWLHRWVGSVNTRRPRLLPEDACPPEALGEGHAVVSTAACTWEGEAVPPWRSGPLHV